MSANDSSPTLSGQADLVNLAQDLAALQAQVAILLQRQTNVPQHTPSTSEVVLGGKEQVSIRERVNEMKKDHTKVESHLKKIRKKFKEPQQRYYTVSAQDAALAAICRESMEDFIRIENTVEAIGKLITDTFAEDAVLGKAVDSLKIIQALALGMSLKLRLKLWMKVSAKLAPNVAKAARDFEFEKAWTTDDLVGLTTRLQERENSCLHTSALSKISLRGTGTSASTEEQEKKRPPMRKNPKSSVEDGARPE